MINRTNFFDNIKASLFDNHLEQSQVDGMNIVLDEWRQRQLTDLRWLAYIFATIYHECAKTMQPITYLKKRLNKIYNQHNSS